MSRKLSLLFIAAKQDLTLPFIRALQDYDLTHGIADTPQTLQQLAGQTWDLAIAIWPLKKFSLPEDFSPIRGLPLIVASRSRRGIEKALQAGASDWVDDPGNILNAVQRATIRQAEDRLASCQARYNLLTSQTGDVIWRMDLDLNLTEISPSVHVLTGFSASERLRQPIDQILTPAAFGSALQAYKAAMRNPGQYPGPVTLELEHYCKGGSTVATEDHLSLITDSNGRPVEIMGLSRDITLHKKAHQAIVSSQKRSHSILDSMIDGITITDMQGRITEINRAALDQHGYSLEEVMGRSPLELFLPEDQRGKFNAVLGRLHRHAAIHQAEFTVRRKDGSAFPAAVNLSLLTDAAGRASGIIAVHRDISSQKKNQQALNHRINLEQVVNCISRELIDIDCAKFDETINQTLGIIGSFLGVDRCYIFLFNDKLLHNTHEWCARDIASQQALLQSIAYQRFNWSMQLLRQHQVIPIADTDQMPGEAHAEQQLFRAQGVKSVLMAPIFQQHELLGLVGFESHTSQEWSDEDIGLLQTVSNIMAAAINHQRAERRMANLGHLLQNIIDSMPAVLIGVDAEGLITQINQQAQNKTGISQEQALGHPVREICSELEEIDQKIRQAIADGRPLKELKVPCDHTDGRRYVDVTIYPLVSNGIAGAVIMLEDVTEQVRLEQLMIQSEKLISVGGLAAGMAHEINNPLAGILQNLQVMKNRLDQNLPPNVSAAAECGTSMQCVSEYIKKRRIPHMLDAVLESGQRAAQIVDNLLSFSRKQDVETLPHSLVQVVERTLELAANDYDLISKYNFKKVEIRRNFEQNLPPVPCKAIQIQQALLSIIRAVTRSLAEQHIQHPAIELSIRRDGTMVRLEINSPARLAELREHIMTPFDNGETPDLGLSVARFIITEIHQGLLELTEDGCFCISLPAEIIH